jgi:predicted chitinase
MRAKEFIIEQQDEGFKSSLAGAALAVGALGAGGADAKPQPAPITKPSMTQQVQAPKPVVPKLQQKKAPEAPMDLLSHNIAQEAVLHKTARAAGIKGVELAQFMAQCSHESADFSRMKEIGGKNYFVKKYDPKHSPKTAKILGNKKVGDGERYHGRGFIQITGRDNYRMAGQALGLPLEQKPELAAKPEVAAKIAVWYWQTRVKPNVSNFNDTASVTKYINPALRGLKDRVDTFKDYMRVMG